MMLNVMLCVFYYNWKSWKIVCILQQCWVCGFSSYCCSYTVGYMTQVHFFVHNGLSRKVFSLEGNGGTVHSCWAWAVALPWPCFRNPLLCFDSLEYCRADKGLCLGIEAQPFQVCTFSVSSPSSPLCTFSLSDTVCKHVNMVVPFFCPLMAFWGFPLCLTGGEFSSLIYSWEGSFDKYHPLISSLRKCLLHFYLCQISSSYWELTYCCAQNKTTVFMDLHGSVKK